MPEGFTISAGTGAAAAPFDGAGGRRRRSQKKLRLVKKKTVRAMLAKKGLKMRGGGDPNVQPLPRPVSPLGPGGTIGGRRRKSGRKTRRRSLFGMKY